MTPLEQRLLAVSPILTEHWLAVAYAEATRTPLADVLS